MTTLALTSRSVARNNNLSDFNRRDMYKTLSKVRFKTDVAAGLQPGGRRPKGLPLRLLKRAFSTNALFTPKSGQQSSVGLDRDTNLTDRYGPCSQRLTPCRRSRSDDCSPLIAATLRAPARALTPRS